MMRIALALSLLLTACGSWNLREAELPRFQDYEAADLDGSGQLNPAEAQKFPEVARQFERYDQDGNGQLAWNELRRGIGMDEERRALYAPDLPKEERH